MVARNFKTYDAVCSVGHIVREGLDVGEVRVPVVLTNGADDARVRAGELAAEDARRAEGVGVVDTGAVRLIIPRAVANQLQVPVVKPHRIRTGDGRSHAVDLVGPVHCALAGEDFFGTAAVIGDEILIGQMVLEETDLWVDCSGLRLVPNPNHPDGPESRAPRMHDFGAADDDPPPA